MIVLVIVSKHLLRFCTESRAKYGEMQAGSGVVFAYLFHCVPETFFYSVWSNNAEYVTRVCKDASDLLNNI